MSFRDQPRGTFFAVALIVAGAILFFDNLGILPVEHLSDWWPLAFIIYGAGVAVRKTTPFSLVWAATLMLFGLLLILGNLGVIHATASVAWPLILIACGVSALLNRNSWGRWMGRVPGSPGSERNQPGAAPWVWADQAWATKHQWKQWRREVRRRRWEEFTDGGYAQSGVRGGWVHEIAIFFSSRRQLEGREITGGQLVSVFGSIELDLRGATVPLAPAGADGSQPARRAEVEATCVFGSIEIRVPQTWRVLKQGTGLFGSYEDKTLPLRPEPGTEPPTLYIRGGAVFGSVTIESC